MILWAIIATLMAVISLSLLLLYRKQVRKICQQFKFLKEHQTNLHIQTEFPLHELKELSDDINLFLDRNREMIVSAHKSEEQLKETITSLSHDIRTPLTSLDGYFQLLSQTRSQEEGARYASIIQNRIKTLRDILEKLFIYAKLQNENYELSLAPVNISQCVYDTLFSFYEELKDRDITPDIQICDEPLFVNGNQEAIERILQNIIKNAFEHGCAQIVMKLLPQDGQAVFLCSNRVEHPEAIDVAQLFDRFYKADPSRSHSSSGLGLSIARELTERMHGSLVARLEGAVFIMELRIKLLSNPPADF